MVRRSRGRPARPFPPRIDATPDEIATAILTTPPSRVAAIERTYTCASCGRVVAYPETLHDDGNCEGCHNI